MKNIDIQAMSREELIEYAIKSNLEAEELKVLVQHYEEQFRSLMKKKYGKKTETGEIDSQQLSLFNEPELLQQPEADEPKMSEVHPVRNAKKKKQKGAKDALLKPLPKETIVYTLPAEQQECPVCGDPLHEMKKEIRKELSVIPASVKVVEHVRLVYSCRHCEKQGEAASIVRAPAPAPLLPGSLCSPSILSYVACRKYDNRDPLYKISQDFKQEGILLSTQTLANWIMRISEDYIQLLFSRMRNVLHTHYMLHADETPLQVLHEPGRTASQKSWMWVFSSGDGQLPIRLYQYSQSRSREEAKNFLASYEGIVQSDGYNVYKDLGVTIQNVGCMAHVRRKYKDAAEAQPKGSVSLEHGAGKGFAFCQLLMNLDSERKKKKPEEWQSYKQETIKPEMEKFFEWAQSELLTVPQKGKYAVALKYTVNQRGAIENYFLDGRLEMTNNAAERVVKPFVLGRKNWLFCNAPRGAQASAAFYSLVETAKANHLKPFEYIQWVLEQMRGNARLEDHYLDALLPWSEQVPERCQIPENERTNEKAEETI